MAVDKFRIWDSIAINEGLIAAAEFQDMIEKASVEESTGLPLVVPPIPIPADMLYNIVASYVAMYDKLVLEGLVLSTSNPKLNKTIH